MEYCYVYFGGIFFGIWGHLVRLLDGLEALAVPLLPAAAAVGCAVANVVAGVAPVLLGPRSEVLECAWFFVFVLFFFVVSKFVRA